MMDLGTLLHHAESTHYMGLDGILKQNLACTSTQSLVQLLMPRLSVFIMFMDARFRSFLHPETKPKFGWSHPEAHVAAWTSYDTENHKIFLKKLLTIVCRIKINSNRFFK